MSVITMDPNMYNTKFWYLRPKNPDRCYQLMNFEIGKLTLKGLSYQVTGC